MSDLSDGSDTPRTLSTQHGEQPYSALSTELSALSSQHSALSTQHSALFRSAELALLLALVWGAGFQVYKLWVRHPHTAATIEKFCSSNMDLARFCQPDLSANPLYVPADLTAAGKNIAERNYTFQFLTIGRQDIRPFDPVEALAKPATGKPRDHRILCGVFMPCSQALPRLFPGGRVERVLMLGEDRRTGKPFAQALLLTPDGRLQRALSLLPDGRTEETAPVTNCPPFAWIFRIPASELLTPEKAKEAAREFAGATGFAFPSPTQASKPAKPTVPPSAP
jgi:hypothetical protein